MLFKQKTMRTRQHDGELMLNFPNYGEIMLLSEVILWIFYQIWNRHDIGNTSNIIAVPDFFS